MKIKLPVRPSTYDRLVCYLVRVQGFKSSEAKKIISEINAHFDEYNLFRIKDRSVFRYRLYDADSNRLYFDELIK